METLRYVVLANGLLAVVSLAFYILLRRETFFGANRLALWLGLAAALILPLLELPDWRPQRVRSVMHRTAQVVVPHVLPKPAPPNITITFPNQQTYQAFQNQPKRFVWSWQLGLVAVYLSGVLVLLLRFGIQLLSLRKLIRSSVHESYDDFTLVHTEQVDSPFSFFNWVVLNMHQHTTGELEQILRHERVHVRERHTLDMLGTELVCTVFWFNPAAYLFRQLLHQTLEFRADYVVLQEGVDAKTYQYNLVKVSLLADSSKITNHFSKSQLKSRIAMLNQEKSSSATWLKYPVFLLAALTIASAFARPKHIQAVTRYVPKPIAETIKAVVELPEQPSQEERTTPSVESAVRQNTPIATLPANVSSESATQHSTPKDSIVQPIKIDSARLAPSRFMVYEGNRLYWIVTPKTTFDDFAVMRQEFAKQGITMQLNEIKYDPLYTYINRIVFTVLRERGGSTKNKELDNDNKPIKTIAGYVGIGKNAGEGGTGHLDVYKENFPESLRKVAAEDEQQTEQFVKGHRLDYQISEGTQKLKEHGAGAATYGQEFFKNKTTRSSGLITNGDGSVSIDDRLGDVNVFVNNEAATPEMIGKLKVSQIQTVVKKFSYHPDTKAAFTSAILIYTIKE
ncbi:hypothetical protein GCM10028807_53790 [Spirosoma daeguense]